jgi:hypothetical protein
MRDILKEYNWDWKLWAMMKGTTGIANGTENEMATMLQLMPPDMQETMIRMASGGEPNMLMGKANAEYYGNLLRAHQEGKKIALVTYNFSPAVLFAMDIVPICLENLSGSIVNAFTKGIGEALDYCSEVGFPETACSGQRTGLGPILAGLTEKPDMVLYSTSGVCDSNAAAYAFAAEYLNIPAFQMNYPPELVNRETDDYQLADFKALLAFLEEQTGHKSDPDKFFRVCREMNVQDKLLTEIQDLETLIPNPVPTMHNMALYAANLFFKGIPVGTDILQAILQNGRENARNGVAGNGSEKLRGLWCYIDHYCDHGKYFFELANRGISHVGSMMTDFWQPDAPISRDGKEAETYEAIDVSSMESMIKGLMGQTSRLPMIKQIRGPYDAPAMWMGDTLSAVKAFKADFMVFMGTMGCRNTWGMVKPFAREMEKAGIPTLISYSDSFDPRIESADTMLDKLLEFLKVRGLLRN